KHTLGTQTLVETFLKVYGCLGVWTVAKQVTSQCLICQKVNKKPQRTHPLGGRELATRPFQRIQVDFTELPPVQRWKYLLVIVDHLTHWVKAFPVLKATAQSVVKVLLEQLIPRFGLPETIDSDQRLHFTSKLLRLTCEALQVTWQHHTPWHPQSSGRVERMNQTLKRTITKLTLETGLPWTNCLPLALFQIPTAPRKDLNISPYEMLFELSYPTCLMGTQLPTLDLGDKYLREYITIAKKLENLRQQGLHPQTVKLEMKTHKFRVGDWVLIKTW
ncbi:TF29 protein, partial [Tachuris rubrigastra]|nr:TF29 protein [Tachuris rubrigastra]